MSITSYIKGLIGQKTVHTTHLQGLTPVNLPKNHLLHEVCDEVNLQTAFEWLSQQTTDSHPNNDVWDYRLNWPTRKAQLRESVLCGQFEFETVRLVEVENEQGQLERREVRCAEERLVIRALTQVLQSVLPISKACTAVKGHGSLKQAVRETQAYFAEHPAHFVMKSDVKGYYAHIDHLIINEQLRYCLPHEPELVRLIWLFMRRTTEFGGNYTDVERGLPLGASISPLLGGLYLTPMDALFEHNKAIFYRRYMDDWIIIQEKRHGLRKSVKIVYDILDALGMQTHPDKTFIGKASKGVSFLGFSICPTGLTVSDAALSRRDNKIAQLYERGASKRRIGLYLARWLGWACIVAPPHVTPTPCNTPITVTIPSWPPGHSCQCLGTVYATRMSSGIVLGHNDVHQCSTPSHTATCTTPDTNNATGTHYYKNTTETSSYFKCDWVADVGYTTGTASTYTPTSPPAPPAASAPPPVYVPFSQIAVMGTLLLLLGIGAAGLRKRWLFDSRKR
ncbi:MAG: hypothetical protein DRR16_16605 [Candidatus Parabeggiatoa sp. nov. 3]|nr:MAG: hypothetical protein DRR00_16450 [Gammaproteobacteria bacterium]RKZ83720.1 MAG: hypothetical protein DRR16_16605 [Gammaproteobacteria bacterium]HEW97949.1 hypothetical protein [Beggiatoa sp.]